MLLWAKSFLFEGNCEFYSKTPNQDFCINLCCTGPSHAVSYGNGLSLENLPCRVAFPLFANLMGISGLTALVSSMSHLARTLDRGQKPTQSRKQTA